MGEKFIYIHIVKDVDSKGKFEMNAKKQLT